AADIEERRVQVADDFGPRQAQDVVAAFEGGASEVVGSEVERLDTRSERAIEHDDPLGDRREEISHDRTRVPGCPRRADPGFSARRRGAQRRASCVPSLARMRRYRARLVAGVLAVSYPLTVATVVILTASASSSVRDAREAVLVNLARRVASDAD